MFKLNNNYSLLQYFSGTWDIYRNIDDQAIANGIVNFSFINNKCIIYNEELQVSYEHSDYCNKSYKAHKKYLYISQGNKIIKYFEDYNLFYELDFSNLNSASGVHKCLGDIYYANYYFFNYNHFILKYKIIGDNKDYIISSEYSKKL